MCLASCVLLMCWGVRLCTCKGLAGVCFVGVVERQTLRNQCGLHCAGERSTGCKMRFQNINVQVGEGKWTPLRPRDHKQLV